MLVDGSEPNWKQNARSNNLLSLVVFVTFFVLSIMSRKVESIFTAVVVIGIGFPLVWDSLSKDWQSLSFFKRNVKKAVAWGIAIGVISSLLGLIVVRDLAFPENLGKQLLIGIPFWLLIISPFQEFFFRGWLQTRLSDSLGKWPGLLLANICFTAWHYLSPIIDQASFPLSSWAGLGSTFIVGLLYGYSFQQSKNVISPWLGHTLSGITFVVVGAMDLFQVIN